MAKLTAAIIATYAAAYVALCITCSIVTGSVVVWPW